MSKQEKSARLCVRSKSGNNQISYFFLLDFKAHGSSAKHCKMTERLAMWNEGKGKWIFIFIQDKF